MLQVVHTIEDWFYERRPKIVVARRWLGGLEVIQMARVSYENSPVLVSEEQKFQVFSAVGGEGFAVASAVLSQSRKPQVVAVVKEENHAKAQALKSQGAVLALDPLRQDWTEEEELVERVAEVLKESTGAYFVAEGDSAAQDQAAAKVYAAAAYKAGVRHVIWSTMEDTCTIVEPSTTSLPLVDGYRVPDFDGKGRGEKYFTEAGLKTMFLLTSFPYEELVAYPFCLPHYSPAGQRLRVMLPFEERVPMMSWKDVGRLAVSIFRWGSYGRTSLCGDRLGGEQIAEVFSTLLREDVEFEYLPVDAFETLVPPKTTRQALMFRYFQECNEVAHKIRETTTLRDPLSFAAFCKTGTIHMGSEGNSKEIKLAHKLALQRKLIVVFGATGQQGNAVAKALLAANFGVRCVTRRPNCAEAKDLRAPRADGGRRTSAGHLGDGGWAS
ncbi:unnamed protein product [Effrenium voratum]|nr:unnamed protein product [Effrenium voratum]